MNTSDIENLEYVISEIEKAKEFWAKTEGSTIFKVKSASPEGSL